MVKETGREIILKKTEKSQGLDRIVFLPNTNITNVTIIIRVVTAK